MEKKLTKKHIQSVMRTMDATQIYHVFCQYMGTKSVGKQGSEYGRSDVYQFIKEFAPTQKIRSKAYNLAFGGSKNDYRIMIANQTTRKSIEFYDANVRHYALAMFRDEINRPFDTYTKRPVIGRTHLYFVSPTYGFDDYNKRMMMPIKGNERFCELLVRMGDKCFCTSN